MKISKRFEFDGGRLFAGANSGKGFISFYDTILSDEDIKRVYILKGGPGTGKSSFMREAAARAEERSMSVERYSCSSDPDSLDAVVLDGRCAILDGTAPHAEDAVCAGAREEIINLGAFWDSERLADSYEKIKELSAKKSESYKRAYKYLEAALNVRNINSRLTLPLFDEKKVTRAIDRLFKEIKTGGGHELSVGMICSVGMKGRVRYDTYEHFANKVYLIDDCLGCGHLYLRGLIKKAEESDTPVRVSFDPLDAESPDAVFFPNDKKAFIIADSCPDFEGDARINMRRFIDLTSVKEIRSEYRLNAKLCDALTESAMASLKEAGSYHFALEELYVSCMDFGAKEVFCKNFLDHLLG